MFSQFEEIMRHHPAAQCGRLWQPENPLLALERLERMPFRQSPPPMPQRDQLSFGGFVAMLIVLFLIAALAV